MYAPAPELLARYPVIQSGRAVVMPVVTEKNSVVLSDPELVNVLDVTVPDRNVLLA
jgi:hypothetical protein